MNGARISEGHSLSVLVQVVLDKQNSVGAKALTDAQSSSYRHPAVRKRRTLRQPSESSENLNKCEDCVDSS
jgi:hypothetical protein